MGNAKFILVWLVLFFASCSLRHDVAGGNATETTNGFRVSIINKSGKPATTARAILRPATHVQGDDPSCCQTVFASAKGVIEFDSIPAGQWRIEITDTKDALFYEYIRPSKDSIMDIGVDTLQSYSKLTGKIPTPFLANTRIEVLGTDLICYPDSYGNFSFDSIPAGVHVVQNSTINDTLRGYAQVGGGATSSTGTLMPESPNYLLLDDFEDGNSQHRFAPISGQGWWYKSSSLGVTITPSTATPVPLDTTDPIHHSAIHFSVQIDSGSYPWANCGVQIGIKNQGYDLSSVDTLVFWAKGAGNIDVALSLQANADSISSLNASFTLMTSWNRVAIPLDTIRAATLPNPSAMRNHVTSITWQFSTAGEIWLDDVIFIGASRYDIWGR